MLLKNKVLYLNIETNKNKRIMKTYRILNHLEDVVKTIKTNNVEDVKDLIYDLKERHGFQMVFTFEVVS